mgnify:CR=1 FL=1
MRGVMKVGRGPGLVELREMPEPVVGPGEVLIRIHAAAVCGTDLHIFRDEHPYWPPVILGHEFSGVIDRTGDGVEGYRPGDRVISETSTGSCGVCYLCRTGNRHICAHKRAIGIGRHGAFAPYMVLPAKLLHRVPEPLALEEAALAEPTAIAVHAVVERARVAPGETVVILGPGPIGLLCLQVARACGAGRVLVSGTARSAPVRLAAAVQLGADATVNVGEEDLVERVMRFTGGEGADVAIETSGSPQAVALLPLLVRRLGRICQVGVVGRPELTFPWAAAFYRGLEVQFSVSSRHSSWVTALRLLAAGAVRLGPLVSMRLPLEEWEEAFRAQAEGRAVKALLMPGG